MKMRSENQYLLRYSLPHYRALYCAAFIRHLQSQHPVSTFGIEKVFGLMKTLPAIQKMLVSPADFSTRPVGRALWEESLLSKIHLSIQADEWKFCPLYIELTHKRNVGIRKGLYLRNRLLQKSALLRQSLHDVKKGLQSAK